MAFSIATSLDDRLVEAPLRTRVRMGNKDSVIAHIRHDDRTQFTAR